VGGGGRERRKEKIESERGRLKKLRRNEQEYCFYLFVSLPLVCKTVDRVSW
jgi:hypothetical protein